MRRLLLVALIPFLLVGSQGSLYGENRPEVQAAPLQSVFLIHGLGQFGGEEGHMGGLAASLRDPKYGLDPARFMIDIGFDYSECTFACGVDCSIRNAGDKLAQHIVDSGAAGDIIIIGYSMGGLIARDMILNHPELFAERGVAALITLGTPHFGYPYASFPNDLAVCGRLAQQMFGDFRNPAAGGSQVDFFDDEGSQVALSTYLHDLNTRWSSGPFPGQPGVWFAAAGTFCSNPVRRFPSGRGCTDETLNDAVVCGQSALFDLRVANGPNMRWSDVGYAHTMSGAPLLPFCDISEGLEALWNPSVTSTLVSEIKTLIENLPPVGSKPTS